jgi:hypothetical protein
MYASGTQERHYQILLTTELDLEALRVLAADYEGDKMTCAAAELRRRLEHYREREM